VSLVNKASNTRTHDTDEKDQPPKSNQPVEMLDCDKLVHSLPLPDRILYIIYSQGLSFDGTAPGQFM
jgi:hypothetical protein